MAVGVREDDASSQMHSSHHYMGAVSRKKIKNEAYHFVGRPTAGIGKLPPSCIAELSRVHLPHIPHANDTNDKVLHGFGVIAFLCSSISWNLPNEKVSERLTSVSGDVWQRECENVAVREFN